MSRALHRNLLLASVGTVLVPQLVSAQTTPAANAAPQDTSKGSPIVATPGQAHPGLDEITVTARRTSESLQKVPDAITAFSAVNIVDAGIKSVGDLAQITPGLNFRDGKGYQGNFYDLRLRGIGQAQGGWPAVAFIVDGVPAASADVLTTGSLAEAERIEVLRGPQSALYGANAIGGAINVVTKRPTDDFHAEGRAFYGNGNDFQAGAAVSGALVKDLLYARVSASGTHDDGRIDSATNGLHLDPNYAQHYDARLILTPTSNFEADLKGSYDHVRQGYTFQDRVPSVNQINDYSSIYDPSRSPAGVGRQRRDTKSISLRLKWDTSFATISSATAYTTARQSGVGSGCYTDVNIPGVFQYSDGSVVCISNIHAFGNRATTGQAIEDFQGAVANYRTAFQDVRLTSNGSGPLSWLVGADGMIRRTLDGSNNYYARQLAAGAQDQVLVSSRYDARKDDWWGVYGQLRYALGKLELTAAGRYDDQLHRDAGFADTLETRPILASNPNGSPTYEQRVRDHNFQPKGQVSYRISDTATVYVTVAKGYRAGYFNTGSFGIPENTTNYEGGFKTQWLDNKLRINASGFHTDYSDQQLSTTLIVPPYRLPVVVPATRIDGAEVEGEILIARGLTVSANVAYLNAVVKDSSATVNAGTQSPKSPHWSGSLAGQYNRPLWGDWSLNAHADLSWHSKEYLYINNTQEIPRNAFVNSRVGIENGRYGIYLVGQNLTNTHETQTNAGLNAYYFVRYRVEPVSYGIELRAKY